MTMELTYGNHTVKAIRNSKEVGKTISVSKSGGDNSVILSFNEINGHEYVDLGLSVNGQHVTLEHVLQKITAIIMHGERLRRNRNRNTIVVMVVQQINMVMI